jgi:hypothetical protein
MSSKIGWKKMLLLLWCIHKHYTEIAKERMHEGDHSLIVKYKALLPTFEDENDDYSESNIDIGVDEN